MSSGKNNTSSTKTLLSFLNSLMTLGFKFQQLPRMEFYKVPKNPLTQYGAHMLVRCEELKVSTEQ